MAETHIKLRADLEIHPEQSRGAPGTNPGVIVKDPISKRFLRFTAVQASALELLDGQHDFEAIAEEVAQKHQVEVLPAQIEEFSQKLRKLLLLDHSFCWDQLDRISERVPGQIRNILHIKFRTFNPDHLLSSLEKKLRFLFSRTFQYVYVITACVALIISILHWKELFNPLTELLSLGSISLLIVVIIISTTIHEFAHGIALKHYGGKVEEMGMMLMYFIPAFYCNISDSWTLGKKQRIVVSMAGGYIQIFLWVLATILWRLLVPDTLLARACLISIMFNGVLSLFNLNPLIRFDGYYILSDYVEIPNLRPKAFSYIKQKFIALLTGSSPSNPNPSTRRERRILLLYGMGSSIFTAGLILYMGYLMSDWMVREYKTWGVIMATALFAMAAPAVMKVKVSTSGKFFKAIFMRIRKSPKLSIALIFIVLALFFPWELKISSEFTVVPLKEALITSKVPGTIDKIYVDEGSRVSIGSVLAEIENLQLETNYQETRGELETQKWELDLLRAGNRPEDIEKARRLVATKQSEYDNAGRVDEKRSVFLQIIDRKKAELERARSDFERNQQLFEDGLIARNELEKFSTDYQVASKALSEAMGDLKVLEEQTEITRDIKANELAQAQSELKAMEAGTREEAIRSAESQVDKLEGTLEILQRELEHLKIRSPIDGIVTTPNLPNRIGEYLDKGDTLCKIVSEGKVQIQIPVPEKEIGDVQVGFPISMKVRVYPRRTYTGQVHEIAPITKDTESGKTFVVYGELDNGDGSLKGGMTGVGKILCGKRMIINIATRRMIRWFRTEFWEYMP